MLGYDNFATRFESLYSPMGNVSANYNFNGNYGGGYGGYGMGYGGYVIDPLMNSRNVNNVIAADQFRNNYYTRPVPKHNVHDNVPTVLGIIGTGLGTAALAIAALRNRGRGIKNVVKNPVVKETTENITRNIRTSGVPTTNVEKYSDPYKDWILGGLNKGNIKTQGNKLTYTLDKEAYNAQKMAKNRKGSLTPDVIYGKNGEVLFTKEDLTKAYADKNIIKQQFEKATGRGKNPYINYELLNKNQYLLPESTAVTEKGTKLLTSSTALTPDEVIANQFRQATSGKNPYINAELLNKQPRLLPESKYTAAQKRAADGTILPSTGKIWEMPQNITEPYISPVVTRKNNRFANISGQKIQATVEPYNMKVDTHELAKLPKNARRHFNEVMLNGTPADIKYLSNTPGYEQVFKHIYS